MTEDPTVKQLPLVWAGTEDKEIVFINELLIQTGSYGEILLTFGQSSPPALVGMTEEERAAQLEQLSSVDVKPIARFALTPLTLQRFTEALQTVFATYEQMVAQQMQAQMQQTTEEGRDG